MLLEAAVPRSEQDPDNEADAKKAADNEADATEAADNEADAETEAAEAINLAAETAAASLEAAAVRTLAAVFANLTMHPVTGAFAESSHESAFAAQFFKRAFQGHVLLMVLAHILFIGMAVVAQDILRLAWIMITLFMTLGLTGRVLLHRMHDTARAQRLFSWIWTILLMQACVVHSGSLLVAPALACPIALNGGVLLMTLPIVLLHGSHGKDFVHKAVVAALLLVPRLVVLASCGEAALAPELSDMTVIVVGSAAAHVIELSLRHSYAEQVQERLRVAEERQLMEEERRRHGERTEQLQAEKERLLYDMQLRPHDDSNRVALRRGLQAGAKSKPHGASTAKATQATSSMTGDTPPSEAGGRAPSNLDPPSLPPGPPSSTAGSSGPAPSDEQLPTEGAVRVQSSGTALASKTGPASSTETGPAVTEAFLSSLLSDEEAVVELQNILTPAEAAAIGPGAQQGPHSGHLQPNGPTPQAVSSYLPVPVAPSVPAAPSVLMAPSRPVGPAAPVAPVAGVTVGPVAPFYMPPPVAPFGMPPPAAQHPPAAQQLFGNVPPAPWQGHSPPAAMTPRQTALYLALQRSQLARTEVEIHQIVRALAIALGASRTENGTVRALHAVLIQMGRPGMSEKEAYNATGASMSNFKKWSKRVQYARLDLPPPP